MRPDPQEPPHPTPPPDADPTPAPPSSKRAVAQQLASLAAPIVGLNVLNVLALMVDTAMCGRLPHAEEALTALGFAVQVVFLVMVAQLGLTVGSVALVARAWGAGDTKRVNHITQQSSQLTLMMALLVAVVGNAIAAPVVEALGASPAVRDTCMLYLRPLLAGAVFNYLVVLYAAILRGVGNTRLAFGVSLLINGLNVVFNYALILGNLGLPSLGLRGAAIGTLMAQASGLVCLVAMVRRGAIPKVTIALRPERVDVPLVGELIRVGTPAALDMVILNAAFLSIIGMLGRMNEMAVAAHGLGLRVQALAFVPGMSISQATGALVGQALGASDVARARLVLHASVVMCLAVMSALAVVLVAAAHAIVVGFGVTPGSELEELAVTWIRLLGYGMPVVGVYIAFVGLLQGSGATSTSLAINTSTTLLVQIPMSALLGFTLGLGPWGVWAAFPMVFVLKVAMAWGAYMRGHWAKTGTQT